MSHSALASLTAQYTDSENEGDASPDSQNSTASQVSMLKMFLKQTPRIWGALKC